jgi:hypothetical protein
MNGRQCCPFRVEGDEYGLPGREMGELTVGRMLQSGGKANQSPQST